MTGLLGVLVFAAVLLGTFGHPGFSHHNSRFRGTLLDRDRLPKQFFKGLLPSLPVTTALRPKRTSEPNIITECIFMTSSEGEYYHKASISDDNTPCGVYIFAEPDQKIEVRFNYLDVPCEEKGGLVSFVDGWELNGEFFPSSWDHPLPINARYNEFCSRSRNNNQDVKRHIYFSSQNVALIQYRMPLLGSSFGFSVRFIKNPTPCSVLFQSTDDIYTLRNYGKRSNCSVSTLFPAVVRVAGLNVGVSPNVGRGFELETGTIHKVRSQCEKRGLEDYVRIGGSNGLDSGNMKIADSLCGLDSKPGRHFEAVACGTTTVRLVSSGAFDNSITVAIRQFSEDDINGYMSLICPVEEPIE